MASGFKNELKSQGAIEAAQDPNSSVTGDDAQRVLLNESQKGGATALHFDPNASPEEKAAQARSQQNDTRRPPKGVGIATDLDGGPDQYDLPPPESAAIAETANAPTAGGPGANGASLEEKEEWSKVGWAPRFGSGETEEDKEAGNLLDHQTLLESKLDDKFFGDWYHNAAVIVFACLSSWLVATLGGGLAWVFIIMATCGTYYRTSVRRVRRNFRDDITRELGKARLETDTESLEWMNSFLVKFWPIYAPQLAKGIVQSVDQVLSTSTPAFLDSMRMETFILGTKPPRMEYVKTYPKSEDDIVMMDWKFSFTPTDTMDMTARQLKTKINPKVVLEIRIGKGVVSKAMKVIVEDFEFSGLMRVKMKLQIPFPHIERVDICFLGRPTIDYVCKPLGGDTFGFDINFIPGLESFIKEQIHGNLAPIMYDPNVFPIEVAKMLSGNPIDLAVGVVAITIYNAHGLKNPDKFSGTPDPYVVVSLNSAKELGRTKTVHENANPRWNETIYVIITNFTDSLTLQVFDYNEVRKDKQLGTATFALDQLEAVTDHEGLSLDVLSSGKHRGVIQTDIRFFPVIASEKLPNGEILPPPESNTGIARITIEQAKELDGSKSLVGTLDPYAVLLLNGQEVHITNKLKHTNNPVFSDSTKSVLITDRRKARIGLVIKDSRDLSSDPVLGTYQIKLDDLMKLVEKGQEWYNLHGTKSGKAKLLLDWKPVALKGATGAGGYITPIGVMRIHVQGAKDLRNFETLGKSDPYARVLLSGIPKGRTVTFKNDLNPDWDEVIYVPMHTASERLTLEVMDEEKLGKDRSLGLVQIAASDYIKESDEGGYEVHDTKDLHSVGLRLGGTGGEKGIVNYTCAFYPTLNVLDPEEEEEERKAQAAMETAPTTNGTPSHSKNSSVDVKSSLEMARPSTDGHKSLESVGRIRSPTANGAPPSINGSVLSTKKQAPKVKITAEDLSKYESGLIVFNIIEGHFSETNVQLEVVMDDHAFPAYTSAKIRQKDFHFGETGDAMVREIDMSRITLRLVEKTDKSGKQDQDDIVAKLTGPTLTTLQQCLYKPTELTMRGNNGVANKVTVLLKYLPVKMQLDPSESINNMGTLRVDVLDAADLPSADRNGYSDPYCKFRLNGKEVFKTKTQKKTLHPAWNEFFEVPVSSRTAADFKVDVYDWDFGDKADLLGSAVLNLQVLEPLQAQEMTYALDGKSGSLRLKMLFKPDYVTRARQGTSTFQGTFAPAGKVIGAPVKGVGKVGGGVVKGASFIRRGFTGRGSKDETEHQVNGTPPTESGLATPATSTPAGTPSKAAPVLDGTTSPATPNMLHNRSKSNHSTLTNTPKGAETGTANFIIVSASGYPPGADVRVHVRMLGARGAKELFKTKAIKSSSGTVEYDANHENFKIPCNADSQFQVVVKDHDTFRSKDLGEGLFFVSDQGGGSEQTVKAGSGSVTIRSSFTANAEASSDGLRPVTSGRDSPDSKRDGRRSFFGRREVSGRHEAQ
ncbi:Tricalbin-2 [Exophiala xenobiotica]|uniref:Tricalbin-2 n=1 Tax=Vermiconidia calcicola TaxID=1690605 RepID=A0AAV9Q5Z7_9PEZI|nr:Tricalbin-2 [Exophiala xenobiotica]KAK5534608.1 Tricalbin-2 [Vermiconidia calcicola]KAK5544511.1 Tricalbin-2 [Chaetothyriales sp. CCFEE 6169]KAK5266886.1 Tricalbin-2 [Exophiala xenobiotica]KAK5299231.1 Tricalbin-2 [Exophiala xenobiotica]